MSVESWAAAINGLWSTASDWSLGRTPRSADSVTLALPATITLTANTPLSGAFLQQAGTLALAGATLSLSGPANFATAASVDGPGTLSTAGATAVVAGGTAALTPGGTAALTLGGGMVWQNSGTVSLAGTLGLGDLSGATATIVNQAGAVFDLTVATAAILDDGITNAAGSFTLGAGLFLNQGTLDLTAGGAADLIYAAFTNTGVITATSGTLELAGGGVLGGAIGGAQGGMVALGAGVFTLGSAAVSLNGSLGLVGGEIRLTGGQTLALAGSLLLGEALVGGGAVDGPGTLITSGATTILADGSPQIMLGDGITWRNTGSLAVGGDISVGDLAGNQATLANAAGATLDFTADTGEILDDGYLDADGYYHQGSSTLANAGLLEKSAGTGTSEIDAVLTNAGTIAVTSGTLALDGGGVLGGLIGASGAGMLELGATAFNPAVWTLGTSHQTMSGTVDLTGGGIDLTTGQTLSLTGTADLAGGEVFGPGTLSTTNLAAIDGVTFNTGLAWRNSGTLELTGDAIFADAASALTNLAGGQVLFASDAADLFGQGKLGNAGLIEKTGGTGTSFIVATLLGNTGSILAETGTLALEGGGILQGVLGGIGAGVLALGGGGFTLADQSLATGIIALAGGTLSLTNGQTLSLSPGSLFDGGAVDGTGTLSTAGSITASGLTLGGDALWSNGGIVTLTASLSEGDASGEMATIENLVGGSLLLASDAAGFGADALATIDNAGLLAKTAGTGTSLIGTVLDSTGTIEIATGALALDAGFRLGGSVTGAGTLALVGGVGVLAPGLTLGGAAVLVDGAAVSVTGNLTAAGSVALASGDLQIAAGDALTLTGSAVLDGGTIDGPGTLTTEGTTAVPLAIATALVIGGLWRNTGTASLSGDIVLGDGISPGTILNQGTLSLTATTADVTSNAANGTGLLDNSGLLSIAAGSTIAADLVTTGTLEIVAGTLTLDDGGSLSGSLSGAGTIALDGGLTTLAPGATLAVAELRLAGGTLAVATSVSDVSGCSFDAGTLALEAGASLSLSGAQFGPIGWGGVAVDGPGTLELLGVASLAAGGVAALSTSGAVWRNDGTFNLAAAILGTASFFNEAGASLLLTDDTGGLQGSFTLDNDGVLAKTGGSGTSVIDAAITGSGTVTATNGTLDLNDGGVLAGTLGGQGGLVALNGGAFSLGPAPLTVAGSLGLTGGTLAVSADQTLTLVGPTLLDGGDVDGPGTLLLTGMATLPADGTLTLGGGGVLALDGTLALAGTLSIGDLAGDQASLVNQAGGLLDLTDGAAITDDEDLPGNGTLLNQGVIAQLGGSGTIAIPLINDGTLLLADGASLQLSPASGLRGAILIGAGGGTLTTPLAFAALDENLILDGPSATLTLTDGTAIEQTLTAIAAGGVLNLAAGRSYRTAQPLTDAGLLVLAGGTLATGGLGIAAGGVLEGFGTIDGQISNVGLIEASFGRLQLAGTSNGLLRIDPTGTLALTSSVSGDVSFAGAGGTLELAAGGGSIGTLSGLAVGDAILLPGVTAASVTMTDTKLTITSTAGTWTATLDDPAALRLTTTDPASATLISFAPVAVDVPDDFAGTGASDLLLRDSDGSLSDGSLAIWDIDGLASTGGAIIGNPGTQWQVAGIADFTGGGSDDILLQTSTGYVELWQLQNNKAGAITAIDAPGGGWRVAATGDFNGDGLSDIVWQNSDGAVAVWEMNGAVPITTDILGSPGTGWLVAGVVNLGTAGSNEMLLQNNGDVALWQLDGLRPASFTDIGSPGAGWHLAGAAAVGTDGLADLVWQNAADQVAVWDVGGLGPVAGALLASPGSGWAVTGVGASGSGGLEIALQNPQAGIMAMTVQGTTLTGSALLGDPGPAWTVVNR